MIPTVPIQSALLKVVSPATALALGILLSTPINPIAFGAVGDAQYNAQTGQWSGTDDTAAFQRAIATITGSAADATYAVLGQKALYLPSGYSFYCPGLVIESNGTGFTIFGEGIASQLVGATLLCNDDSVCLFNFSLIGIEDGTGITFTRSGRRASYVQNLRVRAFEIGLLIEGGSGDLIDNCIFESNGVNVRITNTDGEVNFNNGHCRTPDADLGVGDNFQLIPSGVNNINAVKLNNWNLTTAVRYNLYIYAESDDVVVECYPTALTATGTQDRTVAILSVTNNGDGTVTFNTGLVPHLLLPRVRAIDVNVPGYIGEYSVVATPDEFNFTVTAPFAGTETGSFSCAGWDVYIDISGNTNRVNDIFFTAGNINKLYLQGYNLTFFNTRLKDEIWIQKVANLGIINSERGRNVPAYTSVVVGGVGAAEGWLRIGLNTGDTSFAAGASYWEIEAPDVDSGLSGLLPTKFNRFTVGEPGVTLERQGLSVPTCYHSGGSAPFLGTAGTNRVLQSPAYHFVEIYVEETGTFTGLAILNGATITGTNKVAVSMYTAAGAPITTAQNTAGVTQAGADQYQQVPFASPARLVGPCIYFACIQYDSDGGRFRAHTIGNFRCQSLSSSGVFGTFVNKTMPTAFNASEGPICSLYK